jgi:hypothetical protein
MWGRQVGISAQSPFRHPRSGVSCQASVLLCYIYVTEEEGHRFLNPAPDREILGKMGYEEMNVKWRRIPDKHEAARNRAGGKLAKRC